MTACGDHHPITWHGHPVILVCSIDRGHAGQHQAYHGDRLHAWP